MPFDTSELFEHDGLGRLTASVSGRPDLAGFRAREESRAWSLDIHGNWSAVFSGYTGRSGLGEPLSGDLYFALDEVRGHGADNEIVSVEIALSTIGSRM